MTTRTTTQATPKARKSRRAETPRPFLKWAGGKGQLVGDLLRLAPDGFRAYHEPFMGGGALFFALWRAGLLDGKKVCLSDVNEELVLTWTSIRDAVGAVIRGLKAHKYEKEYFYEVRKLDWRALSASKAAGRMIFLNRTGFNGLYRVNSRGQFNVPFGRYKNPTICDAENLKAVSRAIKEVDIRIDPFEAVLKRARKGDLVYFDPPYVPVSDTANFVAYARGGFAEGDQERLASTFAKLAERGVHVMLSNSDTPWVRKAYKAFRQEKVLANRRVNTRADRRGPVSELVVLSY